MPTIKDIAARAGVSQATVSRYLNGQIKLRDETCKRIDAAVADLGYKPNYFARSLVLKETQTIGVIVPDITNPYFSGFGRGVEDEAQKMGWSVILCNSDNKVPKEREYMRLLEYKQVDGVVLVSSGQSEEELSEFLNRGMTILLVGRRIQNALVDIVVINNFKGGYEATSFLIQQGHRRIAAVGSRKSVSTSVERVQGYQQALVDCGIEIDESIIFMDGTLQFEDGFSAMEKILRIDPLPTAVFATNDLMAIGAINAIQESGLSVPENISVIGFDGIPGGSWIRPKLTTMEASPYQLGEKSVQVLFERLAEKEQPQQKTIVVDAKLLIKDSCCSYFNIKKKE